MRQIQYSMRIIIALTLSLIAASAARAADITMLEVSDGGGSAHVNLGDWGWDNQTNLSVFADESWMTEGHYAIDVDLLAEDNGRGTLLTIPTAFQKTVTNLTTYHWTGFETTIIPSPGATISTVAAQPNANFGNVNVVDNNDGTFTILWDNMGNNGSGVSINGATILDFSFEVTGPSSQFVNYKIRQVPIPEPATAALVMLALCVTSRRRRR